MTTMMTATVTTATVTIRTMTTATVTTATVTMTTMATATVTTATVVTAISFFRSRHSVVHSSLVAGEPYPLPRVSPRGCSRLNPRT